MARKEDITQADKAQDPQIVCLCEYERKKQQHDGISVKAISAFKKFAKHHLSLLACITSLS
jgi:hypothetical protein